jgi:DNA-binding response OmpR family regulator
LDEAARQLKRTEVRFASIILESNLPDGNGPEFCAELRALGHAMPIIMVTNSSAESDVIRGLNAGANDYVTKPFRSGELLARLRAQLRIFDDRENATFTIGPFAFRPAAKLLSRTDKNQRVKLAAKEAAILKYLCRAGEHGASREELLSDVWDQNSGATKHALETHIYRLRQKLEIDKDRFRLLASTSRGYRLNGCLPHPPDADLGSASTRQGTIGFIPA